MQRGTTSSADDPSGTWKRPARRPVGHGRPPCMPAGRHVLGLLLLLPLLAVPSVWVGT